MISEKKLHFIRNEKWGVFFSLITFHFNHNLYISFFYIHSFLWQSSFIFIHFYDNQVSRNKSKLILLQTISLLLIPNFNHSSHNAFICPLLISPDILWQKSLTNLKEPWQIFLLLLWEKTGIILYLSNNSVKLKFKHNGKD